MAIIIGFGTTVGGAFLGTQCAVSAQWGFNPNTQRLYCLGQFAPTKTIQKPTETVSVTIYSDTSNPTQDVSIKPSDDCSDLDTYEVTISPGACTGRSGAITVNPLTGTNWILTGYSYSKGDPQMPGQETWSFTRWIAGNNTDSPAPSVLIRGVTEGQATMSSTTDVPPVMNSGITFEMTSPPILSQSGSVSAGQQGQADNVYYGQVISVGAPSAGGGEMCTGSVTIPITPLWI